MSRLRWPVLLATAVGLGAGLWAIGRVGLADIVAAIAGMGWSSFGLFVLTLIPVIATLGLAWRASTEPQGRSPPVAFMWARLVREAANELLPFSQVGGLVIGTRVLISAGMAPARVYAATVVDLTTEMMAQAVLTLFALAALGAAVTGQTAGPEVARLAWVAAAGLVALAGGMAVAQRPVLRLAAIAAGRLLPSAGVAIEAVRLELVRFGQRRSAMLAPFLWNLAAWFLSIGAAWVALRLLGVRLPFAAVLAIESLIFALRSTAFLIPAAIGVQEVGYLVIGPVFGLDRDMALALSLVKRAREVTVGVPTLLLWQLMEARAGREDRLGA